MRLDDLRITELDHKPIISNTTNFVDPLSSVNNFHTLSKLPKFLKHVTLAFVIPITLNNLRPRYVAKNDRTKTLLPTVKNSKQKFRKKGTRWDALLQRLGSVMSRLLILRKQQARGT